MIATVRLLLDALEEMDIGMDSFGLEYDHWSHRPQWYCLYCVGENTAVAGEFRHKEGCPVVIAKQAVCELEGGE
jgi:hypothetical protein